MKYRLEKIRIHKFVGKEKKRPAFMDHFHILDAYRSNKKLVPIDAELFDAMGQDGDAEFRNVFKAAHQTKEKHESLKRRERAQKWSLATVETMVAIMATIFVVGIANSDYSRAMKAAYSFITLSVFVIAGIYLYLILFSKRMFNTTRHRKTIEEIYGMDVDETNNAFKAARDIRNLEIECQDNDDITCPRDSTDAKMTKKLRKLEAAVRPGPFQGSDDQASDEPTQGYGYLKRAIKRGMLYTMTGDAGQTIDSMVRKLRSILGSETYRVIEETDVYDIIDDIIVPKMIAANSQIVQRKKDSKGAGAAAAGGAGEDQCDGWCGETVEKLVEDALDPKKTVPSNLREQAWDRCRKDMENVCHSARLKTGEQQCAFGCAKAEEKEVSFSTIRLDNHSPKDNWTEQIELDADESAQGVGLEKLCMDGAMDADDVDAAYFGPVEANGPNKCFFHFTAGDNSGGKGKFEKSEGDAFSGKLLYKENHNVEVPGATPAEVANGIANEVRAVQSSFDLTSYDTHVYDSLRYQDASFNANREFYEGVYDNLVEMLKPQLEEVDDLLVPSIQRINESLTEMTARKFRTDVVWPVARSTGFLHIRAVRLDQKESYMPISIEGDIRRRFGYKILIFGLSVAASLFSYFSFMAEREAANRPDGKITLKNLVFDMWHRNVVALSVILMFWTIVYSWLMRANSRDVFNDHVKEENTRRFIQDVYDLRTFLFGLTGTMPELAGDDNTARFDEKRMPLMEAVHTNKVDLIKQFSRPDELIINTLTLEKKLAFVKLCQAVVKSYDRCNKLDSGGAVPFPMPEVIVYATSLVVLAFGMVYMYSRFNVTEVAQRVERVRKLRPKIYMGDASAAREVAGLLECAENTAEARVDLMKNAFVGMIGVVGIMVTVLLINSNDEYVASLNSGFMVGRGRCVT